MTSDASPGSPESLDLRDFGWTDERAGQLAALAADGTDPTSGQDPEPGLESARVVFESRDLYRVVTVRGEREARLAGRLRRGDDLPAVGDWVAVAALGDGAVVIHHILPRHTRLSRKVAGQQTREQVVAANVDTVFLVMGLDGDHNLRRLERLAVMAWESGARPVAVLTKADLHDDPAGARLDAQTVVPGIAVFAVSSTLDRGLEPLRALLEPGATVALIGSSGAGKSTLVNRLCGDEVMRTGEVRAGDDRGRHTTTHRQLVRLPGGGLLVDNPGIREIQLWADEEALAEAFGDLEELAAACRFRDCTHEGEPGCAVLAAVVDGSLDGARLESWRRLARELRSLERRRDVAASRQEDRRLGRFYKRVQAEKKGRREGR